MTAPEDLHLARQIASRIVAAGRDQVRLVSLIGARARGNAREDSDLDLVVVIEVGAGKPRWNGVMADEERNRLLPAIGPAPFKVDLSVRSGEQYEEARNVIGGVERLVQTEGVAVYTRPFDVPPIRTRSADSVRKNLVRAWIAGSALSIERALHSEHNVGSSAAPSQAAGLHAATRITASIGGTEIVLRRPAPAARDARYFWYRSLQQSLTAVCVRYQIDTSKNDAVNEVIGRIRPYSKALGGRLVSILQLESPQLIARRALELALELVPRTEMATKEVLAARRVLTNSRA
jgi:predicted nucleotidyltransferase